MESVGTGAPDSDQWSAGCRAFLNGQKKSEEKHFMTCVTKCDTNFVHVIRNSNFKVYKYSFTRM